MAATVCLFCRPSQCPLGPQPAWSASSPKTAMILPGIDKGSPSEQQALLREGDSGEGPLSAPPPSFEETAVDGSAAFDDAGDSFSGGGDEPPEFTPYDAEHWISTSGEIISHDSHLNEDGECQVTVPRRQPATSFARPFIFTSEPAPNR
jgi:hypothetical protein